MGYRAKRTKAKKLARKQARQAELAQMGESMMPANELIPRELRGPSKQKARRWTFFALVTKLRYVSAEGQIVESADEAARDENDQPVQKPVVHKFTQSQLVIGDEKLAKRVAKEIADDLGKQEANLNIQVKPVPHETISVEIAQQLNGLKGQLDILQLAYELALEDYAQSKIPSSLNVGELKMAYYQQAFQKIYQPAKPEGLVDASGQPVQEQPVAAEATTPVEATPVEG